MTTAITNVQPAQSQRRQAKRSKRSRRQKAARRQPQAPAPIVDDFRAQHLALAQRQIVTELGRTSVTVDETESPLVWLARRRGRDGRLRALI
jgi:hypothetical protein